MSGLKFRHETKHELRYSEYLAVRSKLRLVARQDKNAGVDGTYQIRSLYFDNYRDKALREKIDGINQREKFRIRCYNRDDSVILLEKKSKINGLCSKQSILLPREQAEKILCGREEFLIESNHPLLMEFYSKMRIQQLRPRVVVDYIREPYIYETGNVRVTFDTDIRTSLYNREFFIPDIPTIPAAPSDSVLMEVKYDEYLPEIIKMCIQLGERSRQAFSKYGASRQFG